MKLLFRLNVVVEHDNDDIIGGEQRVADCVRKAISSWDGDESSGFRPIKVVDVDAKALGKKASKKTRGEQ